MGTVCLWGFMLAQKSSIQGKEFLAQNVPVILLIKMSCRNMGSDCNVAKRTALNTCVFARDFHYF